MRHNAPALGLIDTQFLDEVFGGVEGAAGLEGADLLVVFAFEEQPQLGGWCAWLGRGGGDAVEGSVCEDGGAVDVWFDDFMGFADRVWGQWEA